MCRHGRRALVWSQTRDRQLAPSLPTAPDRRLLKFELCREAHKRGIRGLPCAESAAAATGSVLATRRPPPQTWAPLGLSREQLPVRSALAAPPPQTWAPFDPIRAQAAARSASAAPPPQTWAPFDRFRAQAAARSAPAAPPPRISVPLVLVQGQRAARLALASPPPRIWGRVAGSSPQVCFHRLPERNAGCLRLRRAR